MHINKRFVVLRFTKHYFFAIKRPQCESIEITLKFVENQSQRHSK